MTEIVKPKTINELAAAVRDTSGSLIPLGAGTQKEFGNPLRSANTVVDLTALNRITEYNPADLTIHVEAGVTLRDLQNTVQANNQTLPLDPWSGPDATIGGVVATNTQGPMRPLGTIRNWIIGMRVVHADGRISKTGGRVVKNVTGYDLAKLYTGSLGSLAITAEVSLKLRPAFSKTTTASATFDSLSDALAVVRDVRNSALQPIACELVGPQHSLWIRFGENAAAVDWQIANLPKANWRLLIGDEEQAAWNGVRDTYRRMGPVVVRIIGSPGGTGDVLDFVKPAAWIAHALNGIVRAAVPRAAHVQRIRERYPAILEKAPVDAHDGVGTFGVQGPELQLMKSLKHSLDPEARLNPGRYVDGE